MIYNLDISQKDYIPELGDGFDAREGRSMEGLESAHYYAEAEGPGVYYISYRVKVKEDISELYIFAGRKQLIRHGSRKAGETVEGSLYLHFSAIIPRDHSEVCEIERIGFSVACEDLSKLEETAMAAEKLPDDTRIPVIYLAGDSTVTDQSCTLDYVPGGCYSSWGQNLSCFIGTSAAVDNQAHCGLTTETFRDEGHYGIVMDSIRAGDYCVFQFGHNDQKLSHLQADKGYRENLLRYIDEIRGKNAIPILVTPLSRNLWKEDGSFNDLLKEHSEAVFEVGEMTGAPVIDLHGYSMELLKKNGKDKSRIYYHPGDMTHTNEYGSWIFAEFIAHELAKLDPLAFPYEPADEGALLADENAGILTGAVSSEKHGNEQKEIFDAMERSGDNLIKIIENAKLS